MSLQICNHHTNDLARRQQHSIAVAAVWESPIYFDSVEDCHALKVLLTGKVSTTVEI